MVFSFAPTDSYTGLLRGKKAVTIYTSSVYGAGQGSAFGVDFQSTFFDDWLRWAGITDTITIHFRPNPGFADVEEGRCIAHTRARAAARTF